MKLSTRARYALRMMLDVAKNGGDEMPVSLANVAERTGISRGYLEQLALALRTARLVRGVAGRNGGYRLAGDPSEVTVGAVVEAAIGPVNVVDCVDEPGVCHRSEFCECRVVYALINSRISEVLAEYTLSDLLEPSWIRSHGPLLNPPDASCLTLEYDGCSRVTPRRGPGCSSKKSRLGNTEED